MNFKLLGLHSDGVSEGAFSRKTRLCVGTLTAITCLVTASAGAQSAPSAGGDEPLMLPDVEPLPAGAAGASGSPASVADPAAAQVQGNNVSSRQSAGERGGSAFSLQLNFDITTGYFYRGIVQERSGFIAQPSARLTMNLYQQDDAKIDAIFGTWNSFHGQRTGASTRSDFTEYWYESDITAGVVLTKGNLSLTTTYTFLTSPSDAFETVQELGFTIAYDDSGLGRPFALRPYVTLAIETGADASDGADSETGIYLEAGIAPTFTVELEKTPLTLSFPVAVGLSLSKYYQNAAGKDDHFGFAQVGAKASVPLPINERYGAWTLSAGVSGLFLGDHTSELNSNKDVEAIGTLGLQVNF